MANDVSTDDSNVDLQGRTWQIVPPVVVGDSDQQNTAPSSTDPQGRAWEVADESGTFSSGQFVLDDLKHLDIETASLLDLDQLVSQLLTVVKDDGIWDEQKVLAVPIVGHPPANFTTEVGTGTHARPIEQNDLLFSPEVALFAAQLAHEIDKRLLFTENLTGVYVLEPNEILENWLEENENNFSVGSVERKDHWEHVLTALNDASGALKIALADEKNEAEAEEKVESEADQKEKKDAHARRSDNSRSSDQDEDEGVGSESAELSPTEQARVDQSTTARRVPTTSPQDIMRSFLLAGGGDVGKASNTDYLKQLQGLGFSAQDRRLIVDQTAWIYAGVLAQVFPKAVGQFDTLDPVARAQINQLVRDYIMQLPDRQAILASLIANPLGRRELILDILQKNSPLLSSLSLRSEEKFNTSISLNSREDTIAQQVPELAAFLTQHAAAEGVVLTSEQANVDAYNELSKLTAAQLRGLSAGLLPVREKIFESAAKSTAQATLALALSQAADISIESIDFQNIILSLDAVVLNLATTGLSIEQIEEYLSELSADAFLALIGVTPQSPLYKAYLENIQQIRQATLFYIREKQLVLRLNESRVRKKQEGDQIDAQANQIAQTALGAGAAFSASTIHQSGKATSEAAAQLIQSTTSESKAYHQYYLKEWNILTIDQQSVVYLLTKGGVDDGYLKQNPETDPLQFPDEYIDIESEVKKDYFQKFVLEFSQDRGAYKSPQKVQQLRARFESQSGIQIGEIKRANHMAHSALGAGATFSASTLHQPPKEPNRATVELKQSIASKTEAYQKHFVDGWEALSNDERVIAVLVATGLVDNKYLKQNPSTDHPLMPREYLEIESEIKKPYFQELVEQFSRDRSAYKSAKNKQQLLASFASRSSGELTKTPAPTTTQYQQAKAFEDKYRAIWNSLSYDEQAAMYIIAGASFSSGQKLEPIIVIVDYADAIGTPEFNSLVAIIAQNPAAVDTAGGQAEIATAIATIGADTSTSQAIAQERMADVAATQQMLAEMSESEQTALATQYGYDDAASLVAGQQDQAQLLGGQTSPEELAVAAQRPRAADSLSRFRRSSASGTSLPGVKTLKQKAKDVGKKVTAAADKAVQTALKFVPGVGVGLSKMWASGKPGKAAVGVIVTPYLAALSTPLGALGAVVGGVIGGLVGGPIGASLGSYALGLSGLWLNHQMGLGSFFNVRTPPSPWAEPIVESAYPSAATTNSAEVSAGTTTSVMAAKPAAAAVGITAAATAIWSVVAMPVYALLGVFVMSVFVMSVIWGAFLAPSVSEGLPTTPINEATQPAAKYATITKTATPDIFDNPTAGQTYATKYAISIQPKPGFKLKITNVSDVYSSFGKKPAPALTSPLTFDRLSQELTNHLQGATPTTLLTDEFVMQYDQSGITGEDAYLVNKITLTFDAYDSSSDALVETNQSYTTSAAITIGKPQVGCWPTNGVITSVPFAGGVTHLGSDAFDIAGNLGEPITSPFVGTACKNAFDSDGYGTYVRLFVDGLDIGQGGGTLQFIFGHFNSYSPALSSSAASCQLDGSRNLISGGVPVVPGSLLGFMGSTGNSTGAHLHYELYSNYHGALTGGVYSSLLRLLMPAGPTLQLGDYIQGCAAQ